HVMRVMFWSQAASFLLMWMLVAGGVLTGMLQVSLHAVGVGALGGVAGVVALTAFYRALALGPMTIVPPLAATGVIIPVIIGLASGDAPEITAYVGVPIAIAGVILASTAPSNEPSHAVSGGATRMTRTTLALCAVAALGFGAIFVALDTA